MTHSLQTEFKEQNFIKECHAVPSKIQIIIEDSTNSHYSTQVCKSKFFIYTCITII